jgi:hypothetical protein
MLPNSHKNILYFENYRSYGSWQIPVADCGEVRKCTRDPERKYGRGEIILIRVAPRVLGFYYHAFAGKSMYEKKNKRKLP